MVVSSVGLRLKCVCSGKAQKQFNSKLQTRFLVREDALKAERNCPKKEEQHKLWSRVPKGGPIPRLTGRLTVGRKTNSNSRLGESQMRQQNVVWVLRDSGPRVTALAGPRSNCASKLQIYPLVREGTPHQETRNCQYRKKRIWSWVPDGSSTPRQTGRLADWPPVAT
jgi:hypothetical protein